MQVLSRGDKFRMTVKMRIRRFFHVHVMGHQESQREKQGISYHNKETVDGCGWIKRKPQLSPAARNGLTLLEGVFVT